MEAIEKMVQEALDSTKSAHKRIDRMEKRQDNLEELTNAFSVLQNEQEHIKTLLPPLMARAHGCSQCHSR